MNYSESFRMSLRSLSANKLRSSLTMLGIIIGTGAVIALLSVGEGAQMAISEQIQSIGSNLIMVYSGSANSGPNAARVQIEPLTRADAEALANPMDAPHVVAVAPVISRGVTVTYRDETTDVSATGTTPDFEFVRNLPAELGQYFSDGEEVAGSRVAVLFWGTAERLFGDPALALDASIRINRVTFTVIGVLEEQDAQGFSGGDSGVIIPLTTMQRKLFGTDQAGGGGRIDIVYVSAADEDSIDAAMNEITWVMRDRHDIQYGEDDFTVTSQEQILSIFDQITSVFTIFLGAIAAISLLVGGIGIMNIMLVSVTERTREIGIRKAVGAKRADILFQFLVESMVLSVVGGLIGIGFGWGVSAIVNTIDSFSTYVSAQSVIMAVSFSMAVGLFFGIYPASRAANLHPIEALRYE